MSTIRAINFQHPTGASVNLALDNVGNVSDSKGNIRSIPINNQGAAYTLVASDSGKMIVTNSNVTVPGGVFSAGDNISIYNWTTSPITLVQGSSAVLFLAGSGASGNRSILTAGLATLICYSVQNGISYFTVTGAGVT